MIKIIKILLINLLILLIAILLIEYISYIKYIQSINLNPKIRPETKKYYKLDKLKFFKHYSEKYHPITMQYLKKYYKNGQMNVFREIIFFQNEKPPILIFGCSFAYGLHLKTEETISFKLSKLTKTTTFNYSLGGAGIQHMLYFLNDKKFFTQINNISPTPPKYAIYIYISNHLQRLTNNQSNGIFGFIPTYKLKNNNLVPDKSIIPLPLYKSFFLKNLLEYRNKKINNLTKENKYKIFILTNEIFMESKRLLQEQYPDIKFVILRYQTDYNYDNDSDIEEPFMWDVLKKEGFIIIESKDLVGRLFTQNDNIEDLVHPKAETWDIIAHKLAEKLDL